MQSPQKRSAAVHIVTNKCVFSNFLKTRKVKVPSLRSVGRLFQATGQATEKPRPPIETVLVGGTRRSPEPAERNWEWPAWEGVLSFSYQRHPSYSSSPSSFCSYSACKFTRLQQTWLLYNSLYNGISQANLNKIQRIQNTLARIVTNTSKFEHTSYTNTQKITLASNRTTHRLQTACAFLHIKRFKFSNLCTYLYNSLSFPSHSLSTRSSDSSFLSIPYVRKSLGKRAFSGIAPRLWNSLPPDTHHSLSVSVSPFLPSACSPIYRSAWLPARSVRSRMMLTPDASVKIG